MTASRLSKKRKLSESYVDQDKGEFPTTAQYVKRTETQRLSTRAKTTDSIRDGIQDQTEYASKKDSSAETDELDERVVASLEAMPAHQFALPGFLNIFRKKIESGEYDPALMARAANIMKEICDRANQKNVIKVHHEADRKQKQEVVANELGMKLEDVPFHRGIDCVVSDDEQFNRGRLRAGMFIRFWKLEPLLSFLGVRHPQYVPTPTGPACSKNYRAFIRFLTNAWISVLVFMSKNGTGLDNVSEDERKNYLRVYTEGAEHDLQDQTTSAVFTRGFLEKESSLLYLGETRVAYHQNIEIVDGCFTPESLVRLHDVTLKNAYVNEHAGQSLVAAGISEAEAEAYRTAGLPPSGKEIVLLDGEKASFKTSAVNRATDFEDHRDVMKYQPSPPGGDSLYRSNDKTKRSKTRGGKRGGNRGRKNANQQHASGSGPNIEHAIGAQRQGNSGKLSSNVLSGDAPAISATAIESHRHYRSFGSSRAPPPDLLDEEEADGSSMYSE